MAESLGGVESLIESPALMTHGSVPSATRKMLGIDDNFVRISAGIEEPLSDYHLTTRLPMKIEEALADYHPCARYLTGKIKNLI